jgi:hypothetical protein
MTYLNEDLKGTYLASSSFIKSSKISFQNPKFIKRQNSQLIFSLNFFIHGNFGITLFNNDDLMNALVDKKYLFGFDYLI